MARDRLTSMDEEFLMQGAFSNLPGFDMIHSSSWPAASAPPRRRPEPPKAPLRRPTMVDWEVPPLELPNAPSKRRSLTASTTSLAGSAGTLPTDDDSHPASATAPVGGGEGAESGGPIGEAAVASEGEEEDEEGVFKLDGGVHDGSPDNDYDDDVDGDCFQLQLVGLDDIEDAKESNLTKGLGSFAGGPTGHRWLPPDGSTTAPPISTAGAIFTRSRSGSMSPPLGASPVLLSALEQVAAEAEITERFRRGTM